MKATVETMLSSNSIFAKELFVFILNNIANSSSERELRERMKDLEDKSFFTKYFSYGFGRNHMWVCEVGCKERLIFVEF